VPSSFERFLYKFFAETSLLSDVFELKDNSTKELKKGNPTKSFPKKAQLFSRSKTNKKETPRACQRFNTR